MSDIPTFLRLTAAQRKAAWKDRKLTTVPRSKPKRDWHLPASIDHVGRELLRKIEREKAIRTKARIAALKARFSS